MSENPKISSFSTRFKKALDELEHATAKINTLSDELLIRLDDKKEQSDFISRH